MAKRVAFLIGNQTFRPDSGLLPLQGPANDVTVFGRLLRDPERGRFEVYEFLDKPCHEVLPDLAHALGDATPGDFFLIYYSGHGKLDRQGRLCLATADTRQSALLATSIPARHLRDLVEESDCDQIVMLLDCCYSGAVEDGLRGDVDSALHAVEDARGFYIMTASTGLQAARETEVVPGGTVMGCFTAALVNGIESGAADLDRKGKILLSDLRHHLDRVIKGQTPQFFGRKAVGDPLISFSPGTAVPLLDPAVLADLDAEQWHRRQGAVSALASVLQTGKAAARAAAKAALERRLKQERDYDVRVQVEAILLPHNTVLTSSHHYLTSERKQTHFLKLLIACVFFLLAIVLANYAIRNYLGVYVSQEHSIVVPVSLLMSDTLIPAFAGLFIKKYVKISNKKILLVNFVIGFFASVAVSSSALLAHEYVVDLTLLDYVIITLLHFFVIFLTLCLGARLRLIHYFLNTLGGRSKQH